MYFRERERERERENASHDAMKGWLSVRNFLFKVLFIYLFVCYREEGRGTES